MPKRILVVDDIRESADVSVTAINRFGRGELVGEAVYGGSECLDRLGQEPAVDLVVLDLNMPKTNGADVIRILTGKNPLPKLKILVTTAWGPGWISHWNLSDIHDAPAFKELVIEKMCDKGETLQEMVEQLLEIFGLDKPAIA